MMSTMDGSSGYQRHGITYRVRPIVPGAPYVLCVFVVGVVLMGVGTFVTAHALQKEPQDPGMLAVGPALLGLGGLLLLGSVLVCAVAWHRSKHSDQDFLADDLVTIGASTFYGDRRLLSAEEEENLTHLHNTAAAGGIVNPAGPDHSHAVMLLANTVQEERERQYRKNSRKYSKGAVPQALESDVSPAPRPHFQLGPHQMSTDQLAVLGILDPDHLGLERLRRAAPQLELAGDFDSQDASEVTSSTRDRAFSMSTHRPNSQLPPVQERLRRNVTFTQASRARLQQQQQGLDSPRGGREGLFLPVTATPQRKRSSRRKRGRTSKGEDSPSGPTIHHLPKYDPELLWALGINKDEELPKLMRGRSQEGVLNQQYDGGWRDDPQITHGSLGNPRRRPTVVMGVRSRHKQHNYYTSEVQLHKSASSGAVGEGGGQLEGRFIHDSPSPHPDHGYHSFRETNINGSGMESPRLFHRPVGDGQRDNSLPRSSSSSQGRPLSAISSESCCSDCCGKQHEEQNPQKVEDDQHHHSTNHNHTSDRYNHNHANDENQSQNCETVNKGNHNECSHPASDNQAKDPSSSHLQDAKNTEES